MVKQYAEFVAALEQGRQCVWGVAEWLHQNGYNVRILPGTTTPNEAERFDHADSGDLEIIQRIEVKQWPKINFQSLEDVPYPNIIVDEAYKIEKEYPSTLYQYLILNASQTAMLCIPIWTKKHWFVERKFDRWEKAERNFYFCPKEHVLFIRLRPEAMN